MKLLTNSAGSGPRNAGLQKTENGTTRMLSCSYGSAHADRDGRPPMLVGQPHSLARILSGFVTAHSLSYV